MSVLIRGMQIQDNCKECRMRTDYDFCTAMPKEFCEYTNDIRRPDWCPLVELPKHHGRLIDADRLMRVYEDRLEKVADRYGVYSSEAGILSGAMKLLMIELGIVEAEEGD